MWALFQKDFRLLFSLRRTLFFLTLCFVVFFAMTAIYKDATLEQGVLDQVYVGLVDEENTPLSRVLLQSFKNNEAFSKLFLVEIGSESTLMKRFDENELTAIVTIPAGFTQSLLNYENKSIRILLNPHNTLKNQVLVATLSSFSEYIASVDSATYTAWEVLQPRLSKDEVVRMNEAYSVEMIGFALKRQQFFDFKPITTIPTASPEAYFVLSIMIILSSFLSIQAALALCSEFETKCLSRILIAPQSKLAFVLSKLASVLVLNGGLLLSLCVMIALVTPLSLWSYLPFVAVTLLTFTTFSLFSAALFVRKQLLLNFLSLLFLLFAIIGGNFIPLQLMPETIQMIARMTPNYWLIKWGLFSTQGFPISPTLTFYLLAFNSFFLLGLPTLLIRKGGQS